MTFPPPPPALPVTETVDSQSCLPPNPSRVDSILRTTSSVTWARVPTGASMSTINCAGGMDSGKYSIPALKRPKAMTVTTNIATVPPRSSSR